MNNQTVKVKVIAGSTREGRFSPHAAEWISGELKKQQGVEVEVLDLKDFDMPLFNEKATPSYKTEPYKNPAVAAFTAKIAEADAYVFITPEYNHSIPAVMKNALDWVYQEWNNKPMAAVSYGSVGGARAVEHLRLIAVELQMTPIRAAVHIPGDKYFATYFGGMQPADLFASMQEAADGMVSQLMWWAKALKAARSATN